MSCETLGQIRKKGIENPRKREEKIDTEIIERRWKKERNKKPGRKKGGRNRKKHLRKKVRI